MHNIFYDSYDVKINSIRVIKKLQFCYFSFTKVSFTSVTRTKYAFFYSIDKCKAVKKNKDSNIDCKPNKKIYNLQ